jgi:FMN-dependent NADH-azoreductase
MERHRFVVIINSMPTLLRIDSSVRQNGSFSRRIANLFQEQWLIKHPNGSLIHRDLAHEQLPHITEAAIAAFFGAPDEKGLLALSDQLVKEWQLSNTILINCAMYNFSISSSLKAYFDHIVRVHKTFLPNGDGTYSGLLKNKQAVIVSACGSMYKGTPLATLDFVAPYLKVLLQFMGIQDITTFSVEGTMAPQGVEERALAAEAAIRQFFS